MPGALSPETFEANGRTLNLFVFLTLGPYEQVSTSASFVLGEQRVYLQAKGAYILCTVEPEPVVLSPPRQTTGAIPRLVDTSAKPKGSLHVLLWGFQKPSRYRSPNTQHPKYLQIEA